MSFANLWADKLLSKVPMEDWLGILFQLSRTCTSQKMNFSIKDFFSKCDQIRSYLLNGKLHFLRSDGFGPISPLHSKNEKIYRMVRIQISKKHIKLLVRLILWLLMVNKLPKLKVPITARQSLVIFMCIHASNLVFIRKHLAKNVSV